MIVLVGPRMTQLLTTLTIGERRRTPVDVSWCGETISVRTPIALFMLITWLFTHALRRDLTLRRYTIPYARLGENPAGWRDDIAQVDHRPMCEWMPSDRTVWPIEGWS